MALHGLAERIVDREWVRRICPGALESWILSGKEAEASPAMRLLRLPPEERAPILAEAAERAREAYLKDPELTEFTALDGEDFWDE